MQFGLSKSYISRKLFSLKIFVELIPETQRVIQLRHFLSSDFLQGHHDYFKKNGVSEKRLMILEGGQGAFNKAYPADVAYPEQ